MIADAQQRRLHLAADFSTGQRRAVDHTLATEPLLSLESLRALAQRLPAEQTRWHSADIPIGTDFSTAAKDHANGRTLLDTLDGIESAASWVFLQQIETDPLYRGLVHGVLGSVAARLDHEDPGMGDFHGWIFISSPHAVTPYHMDHESNFLLQIRGDKEVSVWDPRDRTVVGEQELETFHGAWSLADTAFRQEYVPKAAVFQARPGHGVFMPFTAPHAVKNGAQVSITLSLTFTTDRNRRESAVFAANHRLRRFGLAPSPVGARPWADRVKAGALDLWTHGRAIVSRSATSRTA